MTHPYLKGEADRPDWNSTSDVTCSESPSCGHCYKTTTFRHLAKSPAYVIDGYDFADAEYSAWAESVWKVSFNEVISPLIVSAVGPPKN